MAVAKLQVVGVRVESPALQLAAGREMRSIANMVEAMVVTYLSCTGLPLDRNSQRRTARHVDERLPS